MACFRKTFSRAVAVAALVLAGALPAADAPFAPEVQQRLDLLKTGYETFVLNNTTIPYEAGVKALNERVKPTLEREGAAAAQRTDLDTLVRIKADLERLGKGQVLTAAEAPPPAALKHAYSAYKLELDRLTSIQKASLADAKRRYDRGLELVQNELTKDQDVTAALQVKQLREALVDAPAPTTADIIGKATTTTDKVNSPTDIATSTMAKAANTMAKAASTTDKSAAPGENLLSNGSFEKGLTMWEMTTWDNTAEPTMALDKKVLFHDRPTLRVTNPALTDTHIKQTVKVKPFTRYRMAGFIKVQDVKDDKGNAAITVGAKENGGGCLWIAGLDRCKTNFVTTDTWTEVSKEFKTYDETEIVFECRLGHNGHIVTGTAWFADVSVTEVPDSAPQADLLKLSAQTGELVKKLGGTFTAGGDGYRVEFTRTQLTVSDLQQICADKRLISFSLNGGKSLTDEGLAAFEGLKKLDDLFFWGAGRFTDAGLRHLAGCENLRTLSIGANGDGITGTGFEALAKCKKLESLTLNFLFKVQGQNLRHLAGLPALSHLSMNGCKEVTDADLEWVAKMTALKTLEMAETRVTDAGLARLAEMPHLQALTVSASMVTPEGVLALQKARPELRVIFAK